MKTVTQYTIVQHFLKMKANFAVTGKKHLLLSYTTSFKCDSTITPQRVYSFFFLSTEHFRKHYCTDVLQAQAALTECNSSCAVTSREEGTGTL